MKKVKTVIVDLDGTLIDTSYVNFLAYKEALNYYGYGFDLDYSYFKIHCNGKHYLSFLPSISTNNKTILNNIHEIKQNAYCKYLNKAILKTPLYIYLIKKHLLFFL